jgi:hypothetical protein
VFDASALMYLMKNKTLNSDGEYVYGVSGEIQIYHANAFLRFANLYNPFNNRTDTTIADGFLEDDLIFVPKGTTITMKVVISSTDTGNNLSLNSVGQTYLSTITNDYSSGYYSQVTTVTSTLITRVVKVPLFIRLANLSQYTVYDATSTIYVNFTVNVYGVSNPSTDVNGDTVLTTTEIAVLKAALAETLSVDASTISIVSYSYTVSTKNVNLSKSIEGKSDFAKYRAYLKDRMSSRTLVYDLTVTFEINTTLGDMNSSVNNVITYQSAGEAINDIVNTVQLNTSVIQTCF